MLKCSQKDLRLLHSVCSTNQDLRGRGTKRDKQELNEDPLVLICRVCALGSSNAQKELFYLHAVRSLPAH